MIEANLSGDSINSASQDAFTLFDNSGFGEKKESRIEYAPIESLFLIQEKKMNLHSSGKKIPFDSVVKKLKKHDKRILNKLIVFTDLRKKGFLVKTALKFGADFRVYNKGIKLGQDHARWIVFVAKESEALNWQDFAAKNRVAHSTKKNLLLALIDSESDVTYYEVSWIRP